MRVAPAVLFVALVSPLLASCSSESTESSGLSMTQAVGPEGGTIVVGGARVTIPKGALAQTTSITITATVEAPPAGFTALSKVFRCEPSDTELAQAVTMEMPFTDDGKPAGMFWSTGSDPTFEDIGGESRGTTMVATVRHFSAGFVGRQP